MRTLLNAIIIILVPVAEFVAIRRIGLSGVAALFIIFATMPVLLVWAGKQDARASQLKLQKAVASFGFQPEDPDNVAVSILPLRGNGSIVAAARGELRGLEAWIFDYSIHNGGSLEGRRTISQTVVAFRVNDANLPKFQIRPLNWSTSIFDEDWKNFDGDWEKSENTICFPDALGFHRGFQLTSPAEDEVRRHFNARLLNTLAALNDCNGWVKGYYCTVLFFTPNRTVRPDELEAFARKGADIASVLFSSEKRLMATAGK
jgi:hypothetical protein